MVARHFRLPVIFALFACLPLPALARESLGLYNGWGAFRDAAVPRCYAISMAEPSSSEREFQPYATIGTWPQRNLRSQVHFRLSRARPQGAHVTLSIGGKRYVLTGGAADAWPQNGQDNAAIIAAMRSADRMSVYSRDTRGRNFSNTWQLSGAATAMDAAAVGCAKTR